MDNEDGMRRETQQVESNKGKVSELLLSGTKDGESLNKGNCRV